MIFSRLDSEQFSNTMNDFMGEESLLDTSTPMLNKMPESDELLLSMEQQDDEQIKSD